MKFDAYCATIRDRELSYVGAALADRLGGRCEIAKPMGRYQARAQIHSDTGGSLWAGFDSTSGAIYVEGKGDMAPSVADAIRGQFRDHTVPRADVCENYNEPGVFDRLRAIITAHKGPRVKGGFVALPDDEADGKTWAAGKRGGVVYIREYEWGKHPDRVHLGKPDAVRVEAEIRPHYARDKVAAARMSPVELWGLTAWSHRVGEALTQCSIPRFEAEVRKYSHDKTTRYIALTFRRHLEEMKANGEHFGATFEDVWREHDERSQSRH